MSDFMDGMKAQVKSKGTMIVVSTPRSTNKAIGLGMPPRASEIYKSVYGALWADEMQSDVWWTKEGEQLYLKDMGTDHIQNCIKMIEKRDNWRKHFLIPMKKELTRRSSKLGELVYGNDENPTGQPCQESTKVARNKRRAARKRGKM